METNSVRSSSPSNAIATDPSSPSTAPSAGAAHLEVLPQPASSSIDTAAALATLMVENGFARRKAARDQKAAALGAMESAQKQELKELGEAAEQRHTAALIGAYTKIGTGAISVGALGASRLGTELGSTKLHSFGENVYTGMTKAGGKELITGSGDLFAAGHSHGADNASTAAKQAANAAETAKRVSEEASDEVKDGSESIDKAIDFLREFESGQSKSQLAAMYRV